MQIKPLLHFDVDVRLIRLSDGLSSDDIHVWVIAINQLFPKFKDLQSTLSLDENKKADQYYFYEDRKRFIVIRGFLRMLLGHYVDVPPKQIKFCYGSYGKPYLLDPRGKNDIHFNLSHAKNLVLYGLAHHRKIGVDIEYIQPIPEIFQLTDRFFCIDEKSAFHSLSVDEFPKMFFQYWTRKEAFIKARGQGLSLPLGRFDVSSISKTMKLRFVEESRDVSHWSFHELFPEPNYVASIVVEGNPPFISCWQWTD